MMREMTEREEQLYVMKLHETIRLGNECMVLRVPGGWIYYNYIHAPKENSQLLASTGVFVPLNNEFRMHAEFVGRKSLSR